MPACLQVANCCVSTLHSIARIINLLKVNQSMNILLYTITMEPISSNCPDYRESLVTECPDYRDLTVHFVHCREVVCSSEV